MQKLSARFYRNLWLLWKFRFYEWQAVDMILGGKTHIIAASRWNSLGHEEFKVFWKKDTNAKHELFA